MKTITCPVCEEGIATEKMGKNKIQYKGRSVELDCLYYQCNYCNSDFANAEQVKKNKQVMMDFIKEATNGESEWITLG